MQTNLKTVVITIPSESVLSLIKKTPTLSKLTRIELKVGENTERVNHYQFSALARMFPMAGAKVNEVK